MSLITDRKYLQLVSGRLQRYAQKSEYLWNFRCPFCGDSRKNKAKARGYVYRRKNDLFFTCHNCSVSTTLGNLIKSVDHSLYEQYRIEVWQESNISNVPKPDYTEVKEKPDFSKVRIKLPTIESLSNEHMAKKEVFRRKIPPKYFSYLHYAENFRDFVQEMFPDHDLSKCHPDPRLVIPFYNEKNILQGVQGRALLKSPIRYICIKAAPDSLKIFGTEKVDYARKVYVTEGPIDSMFLDNAIATMDGSLYRVTRVLGQHDYVFVFDNQPRNPELLSNMERTISMGGSVFFWPKSIHVKDINDLVLSGMQPSEIMDMIDKNTYTDLRAKLEFETWRKHD